MNPLEQKRIINDLENALKIVRAIIPQTPCTTCDSLSSNGLCTIYNAIVPEEAIATGCDQWNSIPF